MRKINLNIGLLVCVLMMALAGSAGAVTHYVSPGQSIQTAIDDANDGDEIEVAPGTYYEAINFNGKAVWLYSNGGPDVTTIDGTGNYHVVQCVNGEDANTILEGFTITGGNADGIDSRNQGGGMYNRDSSPTVKNCTFTGNSAGYGGGMLNDSSSPTITDCNFIDNTATDFGGGMENYNGGSPTVNNCLFSG
ncbi:MAG: right-handed parallel beta-helix repeat-containing protein, partial [Planctomycetota bacterium]